MYTERLSSGAGSWPVWAEPGSPWVGCLGVQSLGFVPIMPSGSTFCL